MINYPSRNRQLSKTWKLIMKFKINVILISLQVLLLGNTTQKLLIQLIIFQHRFLTHFFLLLRQQIQEATCSGQVKGYHWTSQTLLPYKSRLPPYKSKVITGQVKSSKSSQVKSSQADVMLSIRSNLGSTPANVMCNRKVFYFGVSFGLIVQIVL